MSTTEITPPPLSVRVPIWRASDEESLLAELTDIVRTVTEDRAINLSPETAIDDVTGWDSMNHVSILVEVECRFDLTLRLTDVESLGTVGDLLRLIQDKRVQAHQ